jgi:polyphosphate kinase
LVVRNDYPGIRRYLHIGTGNYHAGTARLYSDLGVLTNDHDLGRDASELFNYLTTGYTPERYYRKLLPAPKVLKTALLTRIERERSLHSAQRPGRIQFKMNALEDADITRALYEAGRDGVQVDLIVRDTCRLRPGIPGLSETAQVISIVGRFLEHTRIYYFQNGGDEEYFIGSADCMKRNLESRVEVVTPVESENLRTELREMLDSQLADHRNGWEMQPDGSYLKRRPRNEAEVVGSQQHMIERTTRRVREATRYQRGKLHRPIAGRNLR